MIRDFVTRAVRGPLLARLAAVVALLFAPSLEAQQRGVNPTPQIWKFYEAKGKGILLYFSVRRASRDTESKDREKAETEHHSRLATFILEEADRIRDELAKRTGILPPGMAIQLTDQIPADYSEQRYSFSRGGVSLFLTPERYGPLSEREWVVQELRRQIAQSLLWRELTKRKPRSFVTRFLARRLTPNWFLLGMGAWLAGEPTPRETQFLAASLVGRPPIPLADFRYLDTLDATRKEFAYQQARSFCGWLVKSFGIPKTIAYLPVAWQRPTRPGRAFRDHFGLTLRAARSAWEASLRSDLEQRPQAEPEAPRRLARSPGWVENLSPSPDGSWLAMGINRRDSRTRLLDLSLMPRFGTPRRITFVDGDRLLGAPAWLGNDRLVAIHEARSPFGQRIHRIAIHRVGSPEDRTRDAGLFEDLERVFGFGGRFFNRTVGLEQGDPLEIPRLAEVGVSSGKDVLSVLSYPDGSHSRLTFLRTDSLEGRGADGTPVELGRVELGDARMHRWIENARAVFLVRPAGPGSAIETLELDRTVPERLLTWPRKIHAVAGTRERILFTTTDLDGCDELYEFTPRVGAPRRRLSDRGGIIDPHPVEGMRWVTYATLREGEFELVEVPLDPQEAEAAPEDHPVAGDPGSRLAASIGRERAGLPEPRGSAATPGHPGAEGFASAPGDAAPAEVPTTGPYAPLPTLPEPSVRRYRPRMLKPADRFFYDEDALGFGLEWRDPLLHESLQVAGWRGDQPHDANWQVRYADNTKGPSWFVGAFDADEEDLLGLFPLADFNAAVAQRGALVGLSWQTSPMHSWAFSLEGKQLEYDPAVFTGRLPTFDPDVHLARLTWTLNELGASTRGALNPIGDRWLTISLARAAFGGDASYWELLGDWRTFMPLKSASDALATRLAFGVRNPDLEPSPIPLDFTLGGPESLRGVRDNSLTGQKFWTTTFEYRHLLSSDSRIKRALDKVRLGQVLDQFRFNRLYASVFFDMGTAYTDGFEWGRVERSMGIELRAMGQFTAFRPLSLRLGFAHGFGDLGENDVYLVTSSQF